MITSTYGKKNLKMDLTKKVGISTSPKLCLFRQITKRLAGEFGESDAWMTNIGDEFGQVLNSALTMVEGAVLMSTGTFAASQVG